MGGMSIEVVVFVGQCLDSGANEFGLPEHTERTAVRGQCLATGLVGFSRGDE